VEPHCSTIRGWIRVDKGNIRYDASTINASGQDTEALDLRLCRFDPDGGTRELAKPSLFHELESGDASPTTTQDINIDYLVPLV
jgi:hypothetical protein